LTQEKRVMVIEKNRDHVRICLFVFIYVILVFDIVFVYSRKSINFCQALYCLYRDKYSLFRNRKVGTI